MSKRTVTNKQIRQAQPAPPSQDFNLNKTTAGPHRPGPAESAVRGFREAREAQHPNLEVTSDAAELATPSMDRRPRTGGVDASPHVSPDRGRPPMD